MFWTDLHHYGPSLRLIVPYGAAWVPISLKSVFLETPCTRWIGDLAIKKKTTRWPGFLPGDPAKSILQLLPSLLLWHQIQAGHCRHFWPEMQNRLDLQVRILDFLKIPQGVEFWELRERVSFIWLLFQFGFSLYDSGTLVVWPCVGLCVTLGPN